jgi:hypothetical protein
VKDYHKPTYYIDPNDGLMKLKFEDIETEVTRTMKPGEFAKHLHETVEHHDLLSEESVVPPDVTIEVDGKSITLPLNAGLYESLVEIMEEEQRWI